LHYLYIIYSKEIDQYYVGETEDTEVRLNQHNSGFFKGSSTSKAKDWEYLLLVSCENRLMARRLENFIKKQKNRKFLESIIYDPEKLKSILARFDNS
jgi:putative endonuclease